MIPEMSERSTKLRARVQEFMDEHIMPNEALYYQQIEEADDRWDCPPILNELKAKAKAAGLWNLFLPESDKGAGLTERGDLAVGILSVEILFFPLGGASRIARTRIARIPELSI